ncbi:MAG: electron transport complex protein RnfG [Gammaproteobacteria bacterium]|nr:MAG: electron transport complex protein RnfG [Gammaproteobacteria bacterium]
MLRKSMMIAGLALGLFGIAGTAIVAITFGNTKDLILLKEREDLLKTLNVLVPPSLYNNELVTDTLLVRSEALLGTSTPVTVYRARMDGVPVAAVMTPSAPDGYSGEIRLLVAINYDGTVMGARVVSHKETPGLGDKIEIRRSTWINSFAGHSLYTTDGREWAVKRDGGVFDQFTGATITPRAIVKAVYKCLQYFIINRDGLFNPRVATILEDTVDNESE